MRYTVMAHRFLLICNLTFRHDKFCDAPDLSKTISVILAKGSLSFEDALKMLDDMILELYLKSENSRLKGCLLIGIEHNIIE